MRALESEARAVFDQHLKPHGRRGSVAKPEFQGRRRSEVPHRTGGRPVVARTATVQGIRRHTRTVPVGENGFGRTVETDPGPQVVVTGAGAAGGHTSREREYGRRRNAPLRPRYSAAHRLGIP